MEQDCDTCRKADTCTKFIGYRFGWCATDYEPKEGTNRDKDGTGHS